MLFHVKKIKYHIITLVMLVFRSSDVASATMTGYVWRIVTCSIEMTNLLSDKYFTDHCVFPLLVSQIYAWLVLMENNKCNSVCACVHILWIRKLWENASKSWAFSSKMLEVIQLLLTISLQYLVLLFHRMIMRLLCWVFFLLYV